MVVFFCFFFLEGRRGGFLFVKEKKGLDFFFFGMWVSSSLGKERGSSKIVVFSALDH